MKDERHAVTPPPGTISATITSIRQETPSIKSFWLDFGGQPFRFQPGQWIDLYLDIDGKTAVGGYSMTSTPLQRGRLELAIKSSTHHAVTRHLHERARVGDRVRISEGQGPFYFRPGMARELVLLGAGIGVTPLISILRYIRDAEPEVGATLLYSVTEPEDILFRDELERVSAIRENLRCLFTLTGTPPPGWTGLTGRIDRELLDGLGLPRDAHFFYCGSRSFVDDMTAHLAGMGVSEDRLVYERWW
jgi:ferredoxin-NADP reductase